jgi:hypothetical protein
MHGESETFPDDSAAACVCEPGHVFRFTPRAGAFEVNPNAITAPKCHLLKKTRGQGMQRSTRLKKGVEPAPVRLRGSRFALEPTFPGDDLVPAGDRSSPGVHAPFNRLKFFLRSEGRQSRLLSGSDVAILRRRPPVACPSGGICGSAIFLHAVMVRSQRTIRGISRFATPDIPFARAPESTATGRCAPDEEMERSFRQSGP